MNRKGNSLIVFIFIVAAVVVFGFFFLDDQIPFIEKKYIINYLANSICLPLRGESYLFDQQKYYQQFNDYVYGYQLKFDSIKNPQVKVKPVCPNREYQINLYPNPVKTELIKTMLVLSPPKQILDSNLSLDSMAKLEYQYIEGYNSTHGSYGVPSQKSEIISGQFENGYEYITWEEIDDALPLYTKKYLIKKENQLFFIYFYAKNDGDFKEAKKDLASIIPTFKYTPELTNSRKNILGF